MKAMILAAGRGERMRPLTDHTPKPMLKVAGVPLIEHHIRALAGAGITELVINVSHLSEQIVAHCGDGCRWGVSIAYSHETNGLETAGGIINALPLLGEEAFLIVNGDVWTDYPLRDLVKREWNLGRGAHLVFVDNPSQHTHGDFMLKPDGLLAFRGQEAIGVTYAGLAVFSGLFFAGVEPGKRPLRPLLDLAISEGRLHGEHYHGVWVDVGTPQRLKELDDSVSLSVQ